MFRLLPHPSQSLFHNTRRAFSAKTTIAEEASQHLIGKSNADKHPDTDTNKPLPPPSTGSTFQIENINKTIEQVTGVHEITDLKQSVTDASENLEQCTQRLADIRQELDLHSSAHQDLQSEYHEMMNNRHAWNEKDVQKFAQLTAQEGKARSQLEEMRASLKQSEDAWQAAQTAYLDAVRRRYHEEQVWQDKWRVLGTYWTWALIGLNSLVFIVGQALHYRRETLRLQTLHDMIRPISEAAILEKKEREQKESEESSRTTEAISSEKDNVDASVTDTENDEMTNDIALVNHVEEWQEWQESWKTMQRSCVALGGQTIKILGLQAIELSRTIHTISHTLVSGSRKWIQWPVENVARAVKSSIFRRGGESKSGSSDEDESKNQSSPLHWPSATLGAASATLAFAIITLVRSNRS